MTKEEYVKTLTVNGITVNLGIDDYGQSYFIEYEEDGEMKEVGLGTYVTDYMESIYYMLDPNFKQLEKKYLFGEKFSTLEEKEYKKYLDIFDKEYGRQ